VIILASRPYTIEASRSSHVAARFDASVSWRNGEP